KTRQAVGAPDILINNAGIVRAGAFWEHDPVTGIDATMRINAIAHMWVAREFLPDLMADTGTPKRILNIASAAGTLANPGMTVYTASKWAVIGWSDSLRLELRRKGYGHIRVTTFCPSYISTGMFEGARGPLLTPILTPERATDAAWRAMLRGKAILYKPWTVRLSVLLRGLLPLRAWDFVAGRVFGVYSTMDHFTGRPEQAAK
ncbi:MAG TPA: SDR family NAD(P)-dependent oxidoreductase, partial [Terrimesophilobacter sp.]|nr:SDR family NAD(P)-dependent oxidoreductase [Terrimesophilobacter sp.]